MTDNPLVSVIIPVFNAQSSISEAIGSVLAQTYQNWEMLVVDNRSTDNSPDVVRGFIQQDRRIRLIESDYNSGGPARPRNTGIRNAQGKYLAFLDSDDLWLPDKLKKEVTFLESNNEYFLVYAKCFIKRDGVISSVVPKRMYSGDIFNRLYLEFNSIPIITVMMLNQKGPDQYFFIEDKRFVCVDDWVLWLSIARKHKIGYIDEPLATYVIHRNNLSANLFKTLKCTKAVMDKFSAFVPKGILIATYLTFYYKLIEMGSKQILKQALIGFIKNNKKGENLQ